MKTWIAVLVAGALMLVGAIGAKAYTDDEYDALVSYIEGIRDDPPNTAVKNNPVHIAKWNRVLAAIGADGQGEPAWPEATIHANADQWPSSPWKRPSDYLKWKAGQEQKPEIAVTAGAGVTEGGDATFTVTATPAPAANLAVSVTVSASGDYGAATGTRTVTVPAAGSATFAVATTDDSADETDGSVTATVNAGSDYTVSASQGAATVSVADNDDPAPDWTDYQTVVDYLIGIRDNPPNAAVRGNAHHIRKWNRVLETIGYDTGTSVTPMPEATIHANADQWPDSPFHAASTFLNWVEAQEQASQQGEDQDIPVQSQQTRFSKDCGHGITIQEDENGVYVITYPEGSPGKVQCRLEGISHTPAGRLAKVFFIELPMAFWYQTWAHDGTIIALTLGTHKFDRTIAKTFNNNVYQGDKSKDFTIGGVNFRIVVTDDEPKPGWFRGLVPTRFRPGVPPTGLSEGATVPVWLELERVLETTETATATFKFGGTAIRGTDYTVTCRTVSGLTCSTTGDPTVTIDGSVFRGTETDPILDIAILNDDLNDAGETLSFTVEPRHPSSPTRSWTLADPSPPPDYQTAQQCIAQDADNDKVLFVYLTNRGSALTNPPVVVFSGGGGTGAAATATLGACTGSYYDSNLGKTICTGYEVGSITLTDRGQGYTTAPDVFLTGGGNAQAKAALPSGRLCGPGGHQVIIERKTDDPTASVSEGTPLEYFLYASPPPMNGKTVKVQWTLSGRDGLPGHSTTDTAIRERRLTGTVTVGKGGSTVTINPPDGTNDGNLHVKWSTTDGSNYRVHKDAMKDTVHVVDDDSLGWYFIQQTLGPVIYEGSVTKSSRIVFDHRHAYWPETDPTNVLSIDFDVSGCALSSTPLAEDAEPVGENAEIPCWLNIVDAHAVVRRVSGDEFQITRWSPFTSRGRFQVKFQVGNDADKDDETITMNPTFAFNNSTGGVTQSRESPSVFPGTFTVTDDDTLDLPDENGKDTIYIQAETAPSTPNCCNVIEDHTPTGWSRNGLAPTATKNVYRSQRDLNYDSNGVFTAATGWSTPEKILDKVPSDVTISFTKNKFSVSENNAPVSPVIERTASVERIIPLNTGDSYSTPPTIVIDGGGGTGAAATAILDNSGHISGFQITSPGEGYTFVPDVKVGNTNVGTAYLRQLTRDYQIPYTIEPVTTSHPEDFGEGVKLTGYISMDAGIHSSRSSIDISIENDDLYEGDETFTIELGPFPLGTAGGAITTTTVTIIDDETAPVVETPSEALRFLGFTAGTQEIDEGLDLTVTGRFVSPVDFEGTLAFGVGDPADGVVHSCLGASYTLVTPTAAVLPAGVETEVDLVMDNSKIRFDGKTGDSSVTRHPKDDPDCRVEIGLTAVPRTVDENDVVTHPGYSIDSNLDYVKHEFLIRDLDRSELRPATRQVKLGDNARHDSVADFHVKLFGADGTGSVTHRTLKRGEIVEFPVRAYRASLVNGTYVKGTALPLDLYSISTYAHSSRPQTNVTARKIDDGYAVKWRNSSATDEENGPCANTLGITMKKHEAACLSFESKIPTDDLLWEAQAPAIAFDLSSGVDKYGSTTVNPGVDPHAVQYVPIVKGDNSFQGGGNAFELRTVGATRVAEPDSGYAWIPFDVYAWRGTHAFEVTGLAFCVDTNQTTASYYHDYTIYSEPDHDLVSQYPEYARYISGYAWGNGQESCSRALAIPENGTRMYIRVLADSHDEGAETIRMKLVQRDPKPGGATIADSDWVTFTITNDGPIPRAWLARFGRTVAEQYLDTITNRFSAARTPGVQGRFAGHALKRADDADGPWGALDGRDDEHEGGYGPESTGLQEALLNSSFSWTGASDDHGSLSIWGSAARTDFEGNEGSLGLDGEVTTGMIGADWARGDWLVGFAAGHTTGDGGYGDVETADGGAIDTSMTSVVPYTRWQLSDAWSAWAILGHGRGDMTLKRDGQRMDAPIGWTMAAAGVRTDLYASEATRLSLISDGLWARTSSDEAPGLAASRADVTRVRLGLEGSHAINAFVPRAEVGIRHDGGDAETGFGVELGAGLAWSDPALGLTLDVSGRTLVAHEDGAHEDRGLSAALAFDPAPETERGPSLSLRQDWGGQAAGGLDALFAPAPLEDRTGAEPVSRWTAEAAWGFPALGGRFTASPHAGLGLSAGARDYTLGWRWTPEEGAPDLAFGLTATRRESDTAAPEHALGFEARLRW